MADQKDMEYTEASEEQAEAAAEAAEQSTEAQDAAEDAAETETVEEPAAETEQPAEPDTDQRLKEANDKYVRLFAEFDNFRKRTDNEKAGMYAEGEKNVLLKVLPLIDNFERALASVPDDAEASAFAEGIEKIYKSFMDQMKALGVTPIEAKGQPFDANFHNAVMHVEDENEAENIVVEEFQKGYMFRDKVLRYAMVKVAN